MRGQFRRDTPLRSKVDSSGGEILYMNVSYEGEGPFHESTRPIAVAYLDGRPPQPGPTADQVADRMIRQANYGILLLEEDEVPRTARDFFFFSINKPLIPREFSVPLRIQDMLEALLYLEEEIFPEPSREGSG